MFQADLEARLQRWGADRCVGDVFVKLCSRLRVYSNYFNNYATALRSIDKVPRLHISQESQDSFLFFFCLILVPRTLNVLRSLWIFTPTCLALAKTTFLASKISKWYKQS